MESKELKPYSEPEEWLYATYPNLHAIWKNAFLTQHSNSLNMDLYCYICKVKPSSGVHYGIKICEADKQFLKRTFHYQLKYPQCTKPGLEVCPPRPRGWCQLCRLTTCLSTPVNIAMIRVGEKQTAAGTSKINKENKNFTIQMIVPPSALQTESNESYYINDIPVTFNAASPTYNYYPTITTPSFYENLVPVSVHSSAQMSPFDFSMSSRMSATFSLQDQLVPPLVINECEPIDLSLKRKRKSFEEYTFSEELPIKQYRFLDEEPIDLSVSSRNTSASHIKLMNGYDAMWNRSSDLRLRSTPSPSLENGNSVNKLSVNSTILGDALEQIKANISASSLANLSSISDILPESEK